MNDNKWIKIFGDLCMRWWCFWSNLRFKKSTRFNFGVKDEDKVLNIEDVTTLVFKLFDKFVWTKDGIDQLWDAITPPPQNYQHYLDGLLKDDCDGFHSLVYYCLYNSGVESYLLSANAFNSGHCILLFKLDGKWYINDYRRIFKGYSTPEEAIKAYNEIYPKIYGTKKVVYNGLIRYDFEKGKFYKTTIKKITK